MMLVSLFLLLAALGLLAVLLLCIWVYRDAKARGLEAWMWALVVLLTSGVGLVLYFLVGRKEAQRTCPSCGKSVPGACAYCGHCGLPMPQEEAAVPRGGGWGLLIGAAVCLVLTFVLGIGLVVGTAVWSGGEWTPSVSTIYVSDSWGDHWNVRWHYTNKTSTHAFKLTEDGPAVLYFEGSSGEGPLILRVWQGEVERSFDLSGEGMSGSLDLSIFAPGKVYLELDNNKGEGKNVQFASHWE